MSSQQFPTSSSSLAPPEDVQGCSRENVLLLTTGNELLVLVMKKQIGGHGFRFRNKAYGKLVRFGKIIARKSAWSSGF